MCFAFLLVVLLDRIIVLGGNFSTYVKKYEELKKVIILSSFLTRGGRSIRKQVDIFDRGNERLIGVVIFFFFNYNWTSTFSEESARDIEDYPVSSLRSPNKFAGETESIGRRKASSCKKQLRREVKRDQTSFSRAPPRIGRKFFLRGKKLTCGSYREKNRTVFVRAACLPDSVVCFHFLFTLFCLLLYSLLIRR